MALAWPYAPPELRQHPRLRRIGRQLPRRHSLGVVDAAGHERLVRVAFEEVHDDLLPHPRQLHEAEALARPGAGHADPAAALLVLLPVAVPVELHLDAAVLVGVDLIARGTGDDGGLWPLDEGSRGLALRAPDLIQGCCAEAAGPVGFGVCGL